MKLSQKLVLFCLIPFSAICDGCISSNSGRDICFEFELDRAALGRHASLINDIANFCVTPSYSRTIKEDRVRIGSTTGYRYNVAVNDGHGSSFMLDFYQFQTYELHSCQNNKPATTDSTFSVVSRATDGSSVNIRCSNGNVFGIVITSNSHQPYSRDGRQFRTLNEAGNYACRGK